jgi:hypothetical protein
MATVNCSVAVDIVVVTFAEEQYLQTITIIILFIQSNCIWARGSIVV